MDFLEYADPLASDLRPGVVCRVSTVCVASRLHATRVHSRLQRRAERVPYLICHRAVMGRREPWSRFEHIRRDTPLIALFEAPPAAAGARAGAPRGLWASVFVSLRIGHRASPARPRAGLGVSAKTRL